MSNWMGPSHFGKDTGRGPYGISTVNDLKALFLGVAKEGASDFILHPGQPVLAEFDGDLRAVTKAVLRDQEIRRISDFITNDQSIISKMRRTRGVNVGFTLDDPTQEDEDGEPIRYRFRANLSLIEHSGSQAPMQIVIRALVADPPSLDEVGLEDEVVREATSRRGMVLFSGRTGSGKTSAMAALKRFIMENETLIRGNLVSFQDPVEYLFDRIKSKHSVIAQSEVPRDVESFAAGVSVAMRRRPALIEVQELYNADTANVSLQAAKTGTSVLSTVHANTGSQILTRLVQLHDTENQKKAFYNALAVVRLLVSQVLVKRVGGGRICLREWVVLTPEIRRELEDVGMERCDWRLEALMREGADGRSMRETVHHAFAAGQISAVTAAQVLADYDYPAEARAVFGDGSDERDLSRQEA